MPGQEPHRYTSWPCQRLEQHQIFEWVYVLHWATPLGVRVHGEQNFQTSPFAIYWVWPVAAFVFLHFPLLAELTHSIFPSEVPREVVSTDRSRPPLSFASRTNPNLI